jgi:hypothetical protein
LDLLPAVELLFFLLDDSSTTKAADKLKDTCAIMSVMNAHHSSDVISLGDPGLDRERLRKR